MWFAECFMRIRNEGMSPMNKKIAAARTVRALVLQIQEENWDLEPARTLAYEELRCLPIRSSVIDVILRQVAEARSKTALTVSLEEFAFSLAPGHALEQFLLSRLVGLRRRFKNWHTKRCT